MKKTQWRAWAGIGVLNLLLTIRALLQLARHGATGHPALSPALVASAFLLLTIGSGSRCIRGRSREGRSRRLQERLEAIRDAQGEPALAFRKDRLGQRIDIFLLFLAFGLIATAGASSHTAASAVIAWTFGAGSYILLIAFLRGFRFDSHFFLSERGIDCRYAVASLQVSWEEIVSIRAAGSALTGSVYIAITDRAMERFSRPMRKYMARLTKRRGAQYRWADSFFFSSASEVASIVQYFLAQPDARALIPTGAALASFEPANPSLSEGPPQGQTSTDLLDQHDSSRDELFEEKRKRAGVLAVGGALLRVLAFFMPWIVATGVRTVTLNGSNAGAPIFSIWFSLVALGLACAFLMGRREMTPSLLVGLGGGAIVASIANVLILMDSIRHVRVLLAQHGLAVVVSPGIGPWVQMVGAVGIFVGGVLAARLSTNDRRPYRRAGAPVGGSGTPPRPDDRAQTMSSHGSGLRLNSRVLTIAIALIALAAFVAAIPGVRGLSTSSPLGEESPSGVPSTNPISSSMRTVGPTSGPTPGPGGISPSDPPPAVPGGRDAVAYQVDVAHDGNARNAGVSLPLRRAWTRTWIGKVGYPLIADDKVFVAVVPTVPSDPGIGIYAFDAATGRLLWTHAAASTVIGMAYDSKRLFVLDMRGFVQAYSATSGASDWNSTLPLQTYQPPISSPPSAWGGQLYISTGGGPGTLYVLDEQTGEVRWSQIVVNGDHSAPTLAGTKVYVGYSCQQVRAFAARTGELAWNHAGCDGAGGRTLAYYGGRLYERDQSLGCVILDAATGAKDGTFFSSTIPAFNGNTGYFMESGNLRAHDLSSMSSRWSFAGDGTLASAPLVVGNDIYVAGSSGTLFELDQNGRELGEFSLGAEVTTPDEYDRVLLTGMNAGDGVLAVAASGRLVVFR